MDEHECLVKKYEIDPRANSLTIVIEETDSPSPKRMVTLSIKRNVRLTARRAGMAAETCTPVLTEL